MPDDVTESSGEQERPKSRAREQVTFSGKIYQVQRPCENQKAVYFLRVGILFYRLHKNKEPQGSRVVKRIPLVGKECM